MHYKGINSINEEEEKTIRVFSKKFSGVSTEDVQRSAKFYARQHDLCFLGIELYGTKLNKGEAKFVKSEDYDEYLKQHGSD